jgi:hypothetical protein
MARKSHCFGKDFVKACKIVKWMWVEEKLSEFVSNTPKLIHFLKEFNQRCHQGVSMLDFVSLIKGVVYPSLLFMDVPAETFTANLLHLQPTFDGEQWILRSLSFR